jgi:hypothetical protein
MMVRVVGYLWASPATALGLVFLPLAWVSGGRTKLVHGVIEIQGGFVAWFLRHCFPLIGGAAACTLGHVVLGQDQECLDGCRTHEHVHVRQYERWGPLMLPLYLGSSLVAWLRGQDPYRDNVFEREAFDAG